MNELSLDVFRTPAQINSARSVLAVSSVRRVSYYYYYYYIVTDRPNKHYKVILTKH